MPYPFYLTQKETVWNPHPSLSLGRERVFYLPPFVIRAPAIQWLIASSPSTVRERIEVRVPIIKRFRQCTHLQIVK